MSERKLKSWLDAGLIDQVTYQKIYDYESERARPLGLWAIIGIGALAIVLGTISVVAANWDDIPGAVRLGVHGLLLIALGAWIYLQRWSGSFLGLYMRDVALLIWSVLGLTFFGHLGQVYQTSSPIWQPMLGWLILFGPAMLLLGRGWLVALLFMSGLVYTGGAYLDWYTSQNSDPSVLILSLVTSVTVLTLVAATIVQPKSERALFWKQIAQISLIVLAAGISFKLVLDGASDTDSFWSPETDRNVALLQLFLWVAGAAAIYFWSGMERSKSIAAALAVSALFGALSTLINIDSALWGGLLFMAYWAAIGLIAIRAQWRGVFQTAVAIVALRLIILSFELAADLLASGFGLIVAGLLTIGVALGAYRFSKAFAPPVDPDAGDKA